MKPRRINKGQSVIEYAMLITIVVAALTAMSIYIMRLVNLDSRQTQKELNYCWNK
jgi:hypothetical protein